MTISLKHPVSEPVSEKNGTGKSLRTGIGKVWYRKKVSEPVSENFGTVKSTGIGIVNIWYRKKVSVSVSLKILGTVKLCNVAIFALLLQSTYNKVPLPSIVAIAGHNLYLSL